MTDQIYDDTCRRCKNITTIVVSTLKNGSGEQKKRVFRHFAARIRSFVAALTSKHDPHTVWGLTLSITP